VGAVSNHGKSESTDQIIRAALLNGTDASPVDSLHREKFSIAPNCASCKAPCGNTSDYPLEAFAKWSGEEKALKEQVAEELRRIAGQAETELPDIVYRGIAYLGYDLKADSYRRLLEELKRQ